MVYARIQDGVVVELFTPPPGVDIYDCFVAEFAATFVAVPDGVTPEQGWTYDSVTFAPPDPDPPPAKPQHIASTEFFNRFPAGALITLASAPETLVLLITWAAAGDIDLTDAAVQAGIDGLVPSVLAVEQAAVIMDH